MMCELVYHSQMSSLCYSLSLLVHLCSGMHHSILLALSICSTLPILPLFLLLCLLPPQLHPLSNPPYPPVSPPPSLISSSSGHDVP